MNEHAFAQYGPVPDDYRTARQWIWNLVRELERTRQDVQNHENEVKSLRSEMDEMKRKVVKLKRKCRGSKRSTEPCEQMQEEVSRMLLALGHAKEFDSAIDTAMDDYVSIRQAFRHIDRSRRMTQTLREDLDFLATEVLNHFALILARLQVSIHEVEPEVELDLDVHDVVARLETPEESNLNRVCECIEPFFRWTSSRDQPRKRKARVSAWTKLNAKSVSSANRLAQPIGNGNGKAH